MSYLRELELIRENNNGILKAEDVVSYAKNPDTELHDKFCWDNDEAAHKYRLHQARTLIRVSVNILPQNNKPYRAYVSLTSDRNKKGGGYRSLADVMTDEELQTRLLRDAIKDMRTFQEKYKQLKELIIVFDAIDEAINEIDIKDQRVANVG